ncbi:MAG: hypothetical protein HKP41_00410 [Desulfobacterales bacterium]|nr:hypothetical protein [Desulfobacterales bacterium]
MNHNRIPTGIRNVLEYDGYTGELRWLKNGNIAGNVQIKKNGKQYRRVKYQQRQYSASHIAMYLYYGVRLDQGQEIDHKDGNGINNKISNLRIVSKKHQNRNHKTQKRSKTGISGVRYLSKWGKWQADIVCDGVFHYLGLFSDYFEACCARKSAQYRLGFYELHGVRHK